MQRAGSLRPAVPLLISLLTFFWWELPASGESIPLSFRLESTNQLQVEVVAPGEYALTTTGEDPYLWFQRFTRQALATDLTVLEFEYSTPATISDLVVFYGPPVTPEHQIPAGRLEQTAVWQTKSIPLVELSKGKWNDRFEQLRLDLGREAGKTCRLRNLQLRSYTPAEFQVIQERDAARARKLARQATVDAFYQQEFLGDIEVVRFDAQTVYLWGEMDLSMKEVRLLEFLPEVSLAEHAILREGAILFTPQAGIRVVGSPAGTEFFELTLPRYDQQRDRTTSRWGLAVQTPQGDWQLISFWKYATDLSAAASEKLPLHKPRGIKGLGGVVAQYPLEELLELGIEQITVNVVLTSLLDNQPHPGWFPFQHAGRTWFVNPGPLARYDQLLKFADEHDIVVSAILLVSFGDSSFAKLIIHPEADRAGHFAMPNLTDSEGVAAYEAVLQFLAQRYCREDREYGRIANWIVHNEVDFGWEWTNMGRQPQMVFMDHYLRSLRMVHNVTRRFDPHSRVFISLTHHWNTPAHENWQSYCSRELLERLIASSRIEGDFAWGVAYHPYPQNLRNPAAWNDHQVNETFETPKITPKNIAVLDRWMKQPQMLTSDGRIRGLLLSEQGFNTPDYSAESQQMQAAGFVYMWRQMRGLSSIEAFHNHRWIDSPHEGGLLLGLRTVPEAGKPFGTKKQSWEVYQALGTPRENEATRFADSILPAGPPQ